jgi:branched-chain amino acid transport system substrate-binding protein
MKTRIRAMVGAAGVAMAVAGCAGGESGGGGSSGNGDTVKIGASIPLSGELAGFGSFQKWGYQHAVDEVNKVGGLDVGGKKVKVKLVLLDDKTDPNTTSNNVSRLITQDRVAALLGSCTPALVNAGALVADRNRVPMVTGCDPLEAFKSVKKWKYVWDIFFDEPDLAEAPFPTLETWGAKTNKKVAILHDNGPDGQVVGGRIWPAVAKRFGYRVVLNASFPVQSTQFGALVARAKASGADVVLVDAVTPQAISIRKQMRSANLKPKVLVMEKGAEPVQFAEALGRLADGVMVGGYWDPSFPYPGASKLKAQFEEQTGKTSSQHIADSNAAANVLLDAIVGAGSLDKEKINQALGKTNKTYVVGPVKFGADHTSKLPMVMTQWQGGKAVIVGPTKEDTTGKLLFPLP